MPPVDQSPLYRCVGALCPGLPYRASDRPHPPTCCTPLGWRDRFHAARFASAPLSPQSQAMLLAGIESAKAEPIVDLGSFAPTARTLPVTPAERCAAGMLRAYVDCTFAADDVADRPDVVSLIDDFEVGASRLGWIAGKPGGRHLTPTGRDLLARVEAEPTAPPRGDVYNQAVRDVCAMLRAEHAVGSVGSFDFAARCIESQFIAAPPAKEPR